MTPSEKAALRESLLTALVFIVIGLAVFIFLGVYGDTPIVELNIREDFLRLVEDVGRAWRGER